MIFYFLLFIFNFSYLDAATNWDLSFQDPATPIMEGIINFHNHIMIFLTAIVVFVA
jgi:cytochrome c oxidase subunit 2|tara:strand:+ start:805 stop:972 length:168 start_codon:yes stop_codon:yes gene_type:complete